MYKILVVDDEKDVCYVLKKFLTLKGYSATVVQNGKEAIEEVMKKKPDIVLLDIRMPVMDGIEVLKKIKEIDGKIGVIMCTAVKEDAVGRECMKLGAYDYITKPFDLEYLENVLLAKLVDFIDK